MGLQVFRPVPSGLWAVLEPGDTAEAIEGRGWPGGPRALFWYHKESEGKSVRALERVFAVRSGMD